VPLATRIGVALTPYKENNRPLTDLDSYMRALLCFSLALCFFISGCGTKGPLYLPEKQYPQPQDTK
jgi:predicted small lipoprotein YifL